MSLEAKDLNFTYSPGTAFEKRALQDVSLFVEKGELAGIIGHTGSGKSTLIQHFNLLLSPLSGAVYLNGCDIAADKNKLPEIRRKVGLVFQYPEHQLFEVSVYKDVAFGLKFLGLTPSQTDERVRRALSMVGLPESYYERSPFELSGGEKRRAAIAGILAMEPEVLILDEPTAGLDPRGRTEILSRIREMKDALGLTVIIVSHSMDDIARLADKVFVMANGRIALSGSVSEVFSQIDTLEDIGLAAPQITYLIRDLNKNGFDINPGIFSADDAAQEIAKKVIY